MLEVGGLGSGAEGWTLVEAWGHWKSRLGPGELGNRMRAESFGSVGWSLEGFKVRLTAESYGTVG